MEELLYTLQVSMTQKLLPPTTPQKLLPVFEAIPTVPFTSTIYRYRSTPTGQFYIGASLKERESCMKSMASLIVPKVLPFPDNQELWPTTSQKLLPVFTATSTAAYIGIIYRYRCTSTGWSYIGATFNEALRRAEWKKPHNPNYGGSKLEAQRQKVGVSTTGDNPAWEYEVLEIVCANSFFELRRLMSERENFFIEKFDSIEHGYNSNRGTGIFSQRGRAAMTRSFKSISKSVKVTDTNGCELVYCSTNEAARCMGMSAKTIRAHARNQKKMNCGSFVEYV